MALVRHGRRIELDGSPTPHQSGDQRTVRSPHRETCPVMQHLLDFIHEHTLERQLYFAVDTAEGELEMHWQRQVGEDDLWEVRLRESKGDEERVHYGDLLDVLEQRGADMAAVEQQLQALVVTQLAFADAVLRDATALFGVRAVDQARSVHRGFIHELERTVEHMTAPAVGMAVVRGGGAESSAPVGRLALVRD